MTQFDRHVQVGSTVNLVWAQVQAIAQGDGLSVEAARVPQLLIAHDGNLAHVFFLHRLWNRVTDLRYFVTSTQVVVQTLLNSPDLLGALNALPKTLPPSEDIQVFEARLQRIVTTSETMARQLPPEPVLPALDPLPDWREESTTLYPLSFRGIRLTTVFFSPFSGGILLALNWRRLGKPHLFWPTVIGSFVLALFINIALLIIFWGRITPENFGGLTLPLWFANLVIAQLFIAWQRPSYRAWIAERPTLTFPRSNAQRALYYGAMLTSIIILNGGAFLLGRLATPVVANMRPAQTYSADGFTLVYPGNWTLIIQSDAPAQVQQGCVQANITCPFLGQRFDGNVSLIVMRFAPLKNLSYSIAALDTRIWTNLKTKFSAEPIDQRTLQIDGHPAIQRTFNFSTVTADYRQIDTFVKEDTGAVLFFNATISRTSDTDTSATVIDSILASVHFVPMLDVTQNVQQTLSVPSATSTASAIDATPTSADVQTNTPSFIPTPLSMPNFDAQVTILPHVTPTPKEDALPSPTPYPSPTPS
ncbi:MAG TPA: hypothetical protein VKQ72_13795 [Aggregatilineales bacterium]|nr:hypothetical protein [Aggregatilineales bacterium]